MNNQIPFIKTKQTSFVLGAVLLAALTQCPINADAQSVGIVIKPPIVVVAPVVVAPPVLVVPPVVVVQDDYLYYPSYGIYFNTYRHQYAYANGDAWIWAPAPHGVTVEVLLTSPSVHMDFHDSVEKHHKDMLQKYPKNWKPAAEHHDQKAERKDAKPDHGNKK